MGNKWHSEKPSSKSKKKKNTVQVSISKAWTAGHGSFKRQKIRPLRKRSAEKVLLPRTIGHRVEKARSPVIFIVRTHLD